MIRSLRSFDRTECHEVEFHRPDRYRSLFAALDGERPFVPRGAGLSYCAAAAGAGCRSISSLLFDRLLAFDAADGVLTCEPGVRVGDLLAFTQRRGWRPPVLPGHPQITVGGCVAFDVHGKSHRHGGNFGRWVRSLTVAHPDHGEVTCSPKTRREIFDLTIGGMGLTGFVTRVELQLVPARGGVRRRLLAAEDLDHAVQLLRDHAEGCDAVYSWNDLNRHDERFGRGVVYLESFTDDDLPMSTDFRPLGTGSGPALLRHRPVVRWMTRLYGLKERAAAGDRQLDPMTAAFPIHGKETYFAAFGRRGFREYQLLIPDARWPAASREIRRLLAAHRLPVTLGSLKLFDGPRQSLRFSDRGVCLALDVPAGDASERLFACLDHVVEDHGGLVNLSKDSRISADLVHRLYADAADFHRRLSAFDPRGRVDSALRRRIFDGG